MSAQDAFYMLPDSLLSFILTKIPIKDAVKSCILSKRWRFLYNQMPELTLSPSLVLGPDCPLSDPLLRPTVENIISNILLLHSRNLEAFHLLNTRIDDSPWRFSHENVCKWVRYASCCNVQHLTLFDVASKEMPPPALFSCTRLATLCLCNYVLTSFPTNFVGFHHLKSCGLQHVQLTDESLVSFISLCPLLQKLEITGDAGLANFVIFSSTIEHLRIHNVKSLSVNCPKLKVFHGYMIDNLSVNSVSTIEFLSMHSIKSLSVSCPKLEKLSGALIEDLSLNGVRFYELSYAIYELKMHCANAPSKLIMDYGQGGLPRVISASRFLQIVGNFQSLKVLSINMVELFQREAEMDFPLLYLLHRLPNLQSLDIFGSFIQELARDPIPDCLASPHANLKEIRVDVFEFDYEEIAIISCFLQSTPFLETMEIQLPHEYDEDQCMSFFKDILKLRRASSLARIIVTDWPNER